RLGSLGSDGYENARESVGGFINGKYFEEMIFRGGRSGWINVVGDSYGDGNVEEGDEIVVSEMEDDGNIVGWEELGKCKNGRLKFIAMRGEGELKMEDIKETINDKT
ncbi:aminotransferase class V-fold PLP-dependent enzyme, partial [Staphylococcus aureus]|uniref:aminotransferase class V-fold PLP-dependent enzyme n=1 Tax=Staphylococcus aureus TaxID=1280 RepID=UPI00119E5F70